MLTWSREPWRFRDWNEESHSGRPRRLRPAPLRCMSRRCRLGWTTKYLSVRRLHQPGRMPRRHPASFTCQRGARQAKLDDEVHCSLLDPSRAGRDVFMPGPLALPDRRSIDYTGRRTLLSLASMVSRAGRDVFMLGPFALPDPHPIDYTESRSLHRCCFLRLGLMRRIRIRPAFDCQTRVPSLTLERVVSLWLLVPLGPAASYTQPALFLAPLAIGQATMLPASSRRRSQERSSWRMPSLVSGVRQCQREYVNTRSCQSQD